MDKCINKRKTCLKKKYSMSLVTVTNINLEVARPSSPLLAQNDLRNSPPV